MAAIIASINWTTLLKITSCSYDSQGKGCLSQKGQNLDTFQASSNTTISLLPTNDLFMLTKPVKNSSNFFHSLLFPFSLQPSLVSITILLLGQRENVWKVIRDADSNREKLQNYKFEPTFRPLLLSFPLFHFISILPSSSSFRSRPLHHIW